MQLRLPAYCLILLCLGCNARKKADLIIHHAVIYTVDEHFSRAQAVAVRNGKIAALGSDEEILAAYDAPEVLDAGGKFIYPGFIDAHAHFLGYGLSQLQVNLTGTRSWEEVIERIKAFIAANPALAKNTGWILGRGWDQNDWLDKSFPDRAQLDSLFPKNPVLLGRVDGHAAIAN